MHGPHPTQIEQELAAAYEQLQTSQAAKTRLGELQQALSVEKAHLFALRQALRKEYADVVELEEVTMTSILQTVMGSRQQRLAKERREFEVARARHDELTARITQMEAELERLLQPANAFPAAEKRYQAAVERKEIVILDQGGENSRLLHALTDGLQKDQTSLTHLNEAVRLGEQLERGLELLGDAVAAGSQVTLMPGRQAPGQNRLENARKRAFEVRHTLRLFQQELQQVEMSHDLTAARGAFINFGDFFSYGLVTDWIVPDQPAVSRQLLAETGNKVRGTLALLAEQGLRLQQRIAEQQQHHHALLHF